MLASLDAPPLAQPGLVYEPKYDGMRALADVRPPAHRGAAPHVALYSRNGHDKSRQFPGIVEALGTLAATLDGPVLLDGEIVAIDGRGRPLGFQQIQGRINLAADGDIARAERDHPAVLILFDLLRDGDRDLRPEPMAARRLQLQRVVTLTAPLKQRLRLSEIVTDDGREMLKRAQREGWEGLIVKDGHARYSSGRRTPAWRKLKLLKQQEFVVGGWTEPRQTRQHFGALLVGYHDRDGLQYAGSVGTGFDETELARVAALLARRETPTSPFATRVKTAERAHWVKPDLVAEVRFTEWTGEDLLRQPVYLGLRDDKRARDVHRETPTPGPSTPARAAGRRTSTHERAARSVAKVGASRTSAGRSRRVVKTGGARRAPGGVHGPVPVGSPRGRVHGGLADVLIRLSELEDARKDGELVLPHGDVLRVTNLGKLFWPALGITKGELLRYYVQVAPFLLPAIDDRPLVMKRFPNGVDKPAFYQQRHPEHPPDGVRREELPADVDPIDEPGSRERLIGGSLTTLLYMAQLAAISQDPWFSRVRDPMSADFAAIDLDPGEGATFAEVLDVARWVKDELDRFDIPAVPKTSGSRGLHIYVPLPPQTTYETGQLLCRIIATIVSQKHPRVATVERMVRRRARGTVYIDFLQNILGKTLATAYSARASDYAGVSTPLTWKEVARGVDPRAFTVRTALDRFREVGDLWAPVRTGTPVNLQRTLRRMS